MCTLDSNDHLEDNLCAMQKKEINKSIELVKLLLQLQKIMFVHIINLDNATIALLDADENAVE